MTKKSEQNMTTDRAPIARPEISRLIKIDDIKGNYLELDVEATDSERQALAERFDLIELENFTAHLVCKVSADNTGAHIGANFSAKVMQRCVVTLEPVPATVTGAYNCEYSVEVLPEDVEVIEFDTATDDPPETIVDGAFDAGIMLTEQFGLELEPFPRSPNADFGELKLAAGDNLEATESNNPFAVLKKLK